MDCKHQVFEPLYDFTIVLFIRHPLQIRSQTAKLITFLAPDTPFYKFKAQFYKVALTIK